MHKVLWTSCVGRAVQERKKLHLILQVFTHRRFTNLHFKSRYTKHKTIICISGHFAPDPVILWFSELPCVPAAQDDQLPSCFLWKALSLVKYSSFRLKQLTVMCKLDTMKSYNRLKNIERIGFFMALWFIFCSSTLLVISISTLLWPFTDTFLWVSAKHEPSQDTWEGSAWQVFAEVASRGKPPLQLLPRPYCLSK